MRLLNPKYAFATLILVFGIWLAMTGRLNQLIGLARDLPKPKIDIKTVSEK